MTNELAKAIYLQAGFERWRRSMARIMGISKTNVNHRAAFLGGALYGQTLSGPARIKLGGVS